MEEKDREIFREAASGQGYTSIAINKDGKHVGGCFIPWKLTSSAINMKTPRVTLAVEDLQDEAIMADVKKCKVLGCYIMIPLEDYSFVQQFHELCDLFILYGKNISDLSFVQDMPNLFLFYLEDAKLTDIRPLIDNCRRSNSLPGKRFGFYHCEIQDTSAMKDADFMISELLIWPPEGQTDEKERWLNGRHISGFRIYD